MNVCNSLRRAAEFGSAFEYLTSVKCCGCTKTTAIPTAGPEAVVTFVQADPTLTALNSTVKKTTRICITFASTTVIPRHGDVQDCDSSSSRPPPRDDGATMLDRPD